MNPRTPHAPLKAQITIGRLVAFSVLFILTSRPASAQPATVITTTKASASGDVRAEVIYKSDALPYPLSEEYLLRPRLRIIRRGHPIFDEGLPPCRNAKFTDIGGPEVRDMDADGEPEILISADCARSPGYALVYRFDTNTNTYAATRHASGKDLKISNKLSTTRAVELRDVRARLTYDEDIFVEGAPRLEITRNGRRVLDEKVAFKDTGDEEDGGEIGDDEDALIASIDGPVVHDLDRDNEPEIYFNVLTRGAYCCAYSLIYFYDAAARSYRQLTHFWTNYRNTPNLRDIDRDGATEFVSSDEEFSGEFGPYATTGLAPVQIWNYRRGRMTNVTRKFPAVIRRDADAHLRAYTQRGSDFRNSQVALAAYLADTHLLGEGAQGWRRVRALYRRRDRREFFDTLRQLLKQHGYTR